MPTASYLPSSEDYLRFLPEMILAVAGTLIMLLDAILGDKQNQKPVFGYVALVALCGALGAAVGGYSHMGPAFSGMLNIDGFATFFRVLVICVGILTVLSSFQYLKREHAAAGDYHALVLFSVTGQCVMAGANELIMIFIGLEISSIATYVLAGYLRDDPRNNEAALKYFLLGSFATAFLLYGIAWIYGATGSTNLTRINHFLAANNESGLLIGTAAALMFVGFAFKVAAAPFQVWAPDVYQGAAAPVTLFMSVGPKAVAFAVFVRVFFTAFDSISARWDPFIWASALLSMVVGNFAALAQTNIKRMLAYSSIAHAGYIMVAITAHNQIGVAAVMFYLAAYALMNIGAFAVVTYFSRQGERYVNIEDFSGLGWKQPMTAGLFSIFLLSLIGVPLTGGFFGKFYIFQAAIDAHMVWLAVLGLLNSTVGAYYYLRVLVVMYMHEPSEAASSVAPPGAALRTTLWATALGTLLLGIRPSVLLDFVRSSSVLGK